MVNGKNKDFFNSFKESLQNVDPVFWIENNLSLDGKPFRIHGNGYKPLGDIYRYIGIHALSPNSKPIIAVKGRQVGMTTLCAALEMYFMASGIFGFSGKPPMRIMHAFPSLVHSYAYSKTKLASMISAAKPSDRKGKFNGRIKSIVEAKYDSRTASNDSLEFKQFEGGSHLWLESTGSDGDRLRNRTIDMLFLDEVQDISAAAIGAATKILTKAQYGRTGEGVQFYLGTPKRKGSAYWKMWNMSSQQYYYLGCESCKQYFPLYTPNSNEWEKIWLYGWIVKCVNCGFEQDKRDAAERGKWIAANPNENCQFIGYHLNQLYMPEFTKEIILSMKPENHPTNTERLYSNEVLGEFFDGDGGPISAEEIYEACADHGRRFRDNIPINENKRVYLGCDWGGRDDPDSKANDDTSKSQGQSFSCVVVLTAETNNRFSVDFVTRLKKNDPAYKRNTVEEMFRRYSIRLAVGDIGYANDLTQDLQHTYGDRFLASRALVKINNHIKFCSDIFPKEIQFEKDFYLSELFGLLKKGAIRFPYGSYEQLNWFVNHCASMEIKVTMSRSGEPIRRFVKGGGPNDGLMALLNAYLAFKHDTTGGFSGPQIDINAKKTKANLPIQLLYLPGMK